MPAVLLFCCFYRHQVHGDLHGENLLLDAHSNLFIIDFGKSGPKHSLTDVAQLEVLTALPHPC